MTFPSTLVSRCGDIVSTPDSLGALKVLGRRLPYRGREAAYNSAANILIMECSKMNFVLGADCVREDAVTSP